ncbi:hypothetical protein [Pseudomonas sp. B392_1p]|uniref:hypothetical protein n=1 Tax=Pseudomonas sp. B392_1p TaxID=3457507 RepID=UPI003FD20718
MKFDKNDYPAIKQACLDKIEIDFDAPKEITVFSDSEAPDDWTAYPPAFLPPEGYAQVFAQSGAGARGELMRLELIVHLDGGRILYKRNGHGLVSLKVTWPQKP